MSNIRGFKTLESACGFPPVIVSERAFTTDEGLERRCYTVKKAKGKVTFCVIQYENGLFSSSVKLPQSGA